jgi:aspartate 1-decarboxylase
MKLKLLKSKIHRATVTEACLDYEGSISIDKYLMKKSGIINHEKVHVLNVTTGTRLETYAIPSDKKRDICINGAAAHLVSPGDLVIIVSYAQMDYDEAKDFTPQIILLDEKNNIK